MDFTKEQLSELICKHTEKENGLQDLIEIMLESLMVSERREYLQEEGLAGNKCNGYRPGRSYGHGRTLTFRIPRVNRNHECTENGKENAQKTVTTVQKNQ